MADTPAGFRQVLGTDPFEVPGDINRTELFLEGHITASVQSPANLPASGNWPGRRIFVVSDGVDYQWSESSWSWLGGDTGWIAAALGSGWSSYLSDTWGLVSYRRVGRLVSITGIAYRSVASGVAIFVLPVGFRPPYTRQFAVPTGTGTGNVQIRATDGAVVASATTGSFAMGDLSFYTN